MSDFDFDALRDPVAPDPDARQRAGVDARARELRGRARRSRLLAGAAAVVAVAAIATGVAAVTRSTDHTLTIQGGGTTVPSTVPAHIEGRFIPPQHGEDGVVVMPVTLPDGERFTVRYPPAMEIAQLGFAGTTSINDKVVNISYQKVTDAYAGAPVTTYKGADGGTVSLFRANQRRGNVGAPGDELAYQFGPWLATVEAPSDLRNVKELNRAYWALAVSGTVDADGYLVLHAQPPLTVGHTFEGAFGKVPGNSLQLASNLYCGQPESDTSTRRRATNGDGSEFVSWCEGTLHVVAEGSPEFVDAAEHDLQITLPGTPTTTTTTTPVASSAPAASASFISPDDGWVLDQGGAVRRTTDGGSTWHEVGSADETYDNSKVRFADPDHGFLFGFRPSDESGILWSTDDGGKHWTRPATPFSHVFDIATANGVVYVAALQDSNVAFKIWSSPVGELSWTEDALALGIGAGPVPSAQFVFSGNEGYLLVNNRTVTAGARLGPDGRWTNWTPPCADSGGPAQLAASSAADLFAVCNEGVYTGTKAEPAVYVSHNGGRTFTRHNAPVYGSIASPYPNRAVIVYGHEVRRTTDDGVTWQLAAGLPVSADGFAGDIGFTTTLQGFVILADGDMFMTRDAGASWQPVTLP